MLAALILTLPTQPNAVRLRIWRALKALGCAALRDGAYLLPEREAARLEALAAEVVEHGGTASVWRMTPRDRTQEQEVLALFDRGEAYAAWQASQRALIQELPKLNEVEARRRWRSVNDALSALRSIDYFPGAAGEQAQADLLDLRQALDARFSRGEPSATSAHDIPLLKAGRFAGKRWATRQRPWVDRLACAWLIRRYIDREARFLWLPDPAGATPPPRGAIGFDYDGARFSHVGARVTFEVMLVSFGLDADPRMQRIARAVHVLDVGGIPVPEAAGLEAVLGGLREVHSDDDELVAAAGAVFDALLAAPVATS
ncbi:MAG TPA: chromate resistance protein ChrB domain-containing protein [Rubrivivax sp.]|nr:chromate resistance protein ChrB domain-containing protein [Rubrivivax sp.]